MFQPYAEQTELQLFFTSLYQYSIKIKVVSSFVKDPRYPVTFVVVFFYIKVHHNMVMLAHNEFHNCLYCQIWLYVYRLIGQHIVQVSCRSQVRFQQELSFCKFASFISFQKLTFPPDVFVVKYKWNSLNTSISPRNINVCTCMKNFLQRCGRPLNGVPQMTIF